MHYTVVDPVERNSHVGLIEGRIRRKEKTYSNPIELAKAIDDYINKVWESKTVIKKKSGEELVTFDKPPSLAGLCLHLGLPSKMSYKALCLDSNRYLAKIAIAGLTWIESHYVESMQMVGANQNSFQFLLSNMGYKSENIFKPEPVADRSVPESMRIDKESIPSVQNIQISFVSSKDSLPDDVVRQQLLAEADNITLEPEIQPKMIQAEQDV